MRDAVRFKTQNIAIDEFSGGSNLLLARPPFSAPCEQALGQFPLFYGLLGGSQANVILLRVDRVSLFFFFYIQSSHEQLCMKAGDLSGFAVFVGRRCCIVLLIIEVVDAIDPKCGNILQINNKNTCISTSIVLIHQCHGTSMHQERSQIGYTYGMLARPVSRFFSRGRLNPL